MASPRKPAAPSFSPRKPTASFSVKGSSSRVAAKSPTPVSRKPAAVPIEKAAEALPYDVPKAKVDPTVNGELDLLENSIFELQDTVNVLRTRLEPVLDDSAVAAGDEGADEFAHQQRTPMGRRVEVFKARVQQLTLQVHTLIERSKIS